MKQSPSWEANSSSASQKIAHILWNTKVHNRGLSSPPLLPRTRLIQSTPFHIISITSVVISFSHLRLKSSASGLFPPCFLCIYFSLSLSPSLHPLPPNKSRATHFQSRPDTVASNVLSNGIRFVSRRYIWTTHKPLYSKPVTLLLVYMPIFVIYIYSYFPLI